MLNLFRELVSKLAHLLERPMLKNCYRREARAIEKWLSLLLALRFDQRWSGTALPSLVCTSCWDGPLFSNLPAGLSALQAEKLENQRRMCSPQRIYSFDRARSLGREAQGQGIKCG